MVKLSAVINTLNEAENIEACIKSLGPIGQYIDEVLVCDNESTDDTVEIAKRCQARVITHPRGRYVTKSRKFAYENCDAEWIFAFDADERPSTALLQQLRARTQADGYDVWRFAKKQYLFGRFIEHGGWFEEHFCQLFRRQVFLDNYRSDLEGAHNDFASVQGIARTGVIPKSSGAFLIHYAYDNIEEFVNRTLGKYARIEAEDRIAQRKCDVSAIHPLCRPFKTFLRHYVRLKGYKDGRHGLIIAILMSYYEGLILMNQWFLATQFHRGDPESTGAL